MEKIIIIFMPNFSAQLVCTFEANTRNYTILVLVEKSVYSNFEKKISNYKFIRDGGKAGKIRN